eukprot:MONOS_9302.1-p1 / transcript=MONOS_9302.1 / gene=MONOS_9302 / organism=Monocercomonoides_exilis_PA203 / gene_product=unspecified product / transcript_product=unspecified product / location=Mono_scaffold00378:45646-46363(-) / protein_length=226 / sequence_SO=supercontig / SO=protein_coding / is_pseudo=false
MFAVFLLSATREMYYFWTGAMRTTLVPSRQTTIRSLTSLPKWMKANIANSLLQSTFTKEVSKPPPSEYLQPGWYISDNSPMYMLQSRSEGRTTVVSYEHKGQYGMKAVGLTYGRYKTLFKEALDMIEAHAIQLFGYVCRRKRSESPSDYFKRISELLSLSEESYFELSAMMESAFFGIADCDANEWKRCLALSKRFMQLLHRKKQVMIIKKREQVGNHTEKTVFG